jgi:glyoxylate carboligase
MKTQRVADLIVDVLYSAGVRRIYGIVGDSLNGITDAVRRRGDIEWVHTRHVGKPPEHQGEHHIALRQRLRWRP